MIHRHWLRAAFNVPPPPLRVVAIGVALALICLAVLATFRIELVEDSYITFRVARNLATGVGFCYNAGEPVEATTNLLWTLLLAAIYAATEHMPLVAPFLGAAAAVAALAVTFAALRSGGVESAPAAIAVGFVAVMPQYWLAAASGLETGLYALLVVATVACVPNRMWAAAALGALAFMTRPEGGAVFRSGGSPRSTRGGAAGATRGRWFLRRCAGWRF